MAKNKKKKPIVDVGQTVPKNLKFAMIVTVAVFWAEFLRSGLEGVFTWFFGSRMTVVVNFIVALAATAIAYLVLLTYRKLIPRLKKLEVKDWF